MHPYLYILIGQTAVPEDNTLRWAEWMETADRVVFRTEIGASVVSTVFLGVDHNHTRYFTGGPPILFETLVFTDGEAEDDSMERCSTWLEAEAQHRRVVAERLSRRS